jgi:hypothetical protein
MNLLISTAYFPPVSYIAACMKASEIAIEQCETYPKQTLRNRCRILGPGGIQILTVPVIRPNGNHTLTRDIRIDAKQSWQRSHRRSIETAYNNSPFYLYYQDFFHPSFEKPYTFLLDLNQDLLAAIFRIFRMDIPISFTDDYAKHPEGFTDLRQQSKKSPIVPDFLSMPYTQVFSTRFGFEADLSILDLIFNMGPESPVILA